MEKIRFVAIIHPEKGNAKRYGPAVGLMLGKLSEELVALYNEVNAKLGTPMMRGFDSPPEEWKAPEAYLPMAWPMDEGEKTRLTLMLVDNEPVGLVMNTRHPKSKYVSFWNFYVKPEWRGKGYGSKLIEYNMAQHRKLGYNEMGLTVHTNNPRAEALYKKFGFGSKTMEMFAAL